MFIEIHMIQNHSPANLNRDDLGAPKTCVFGGVTRSRISSQCTKRSVRNPGKAKNPDDPESPFEGSSMFAEAMRCRMGLRTKLFPWLVGNELRSSQIPVEEHDRIVLAARRIATEKEKEDKGKSAREQADKRPKTPQLIHIGRGHAADFVKQLWALRESHAEHYRYFLHPVVGFQESVRLNLDADALKEEDIRKIVKASWVVAKCRMGELLKADEGEEPIEEPALEGRQPGLEHAELVATRLVDLMSADKTRFTVLVKSPSPEEKRQLKEDEPEKPLGGMDKFMAQLMSAQRMNPIDIALFGRMTTSDAFQNVEAAMQVAHAVSTHAATNEVDYFTAVDDLGKGAGAGHVGEAQFTSACFYKYFSLDWNQLVHNLAGPAPKAPNKTAKKEEHEAHQKAMEAYAQARQDAMRLAACALGHFLIGVARISPSGKQNSFASHCEPCGILVEIKDNMTPTSYANAFAEPVERIGRPEDDVADEKSIEGRSVACLADHVHSLRRAYNSDSALLWYSPKLWRFPLQYWERTEDGAKQTPKFVTEQRFHVLSGEPGKPAGLVEGVIEALKLTGDQGKPLTWESAKDAGKVQAAEAKS